MLARGDSDSFTLQRRTLSGIDDFEALSGPTLQIRRGGELRVDATTMSRHDDSAPALRYVVEEGAAAPRDYSSLMMLSAAHHFGEVLRDVGAATGHSAEGFVERSGALTVLFEPTISASNGGANLEIVRENNAFFSADPWLFAIDRRGERELAPLAAARGVFAHELGHSVFQASFLGGTVERCDPANSQENAGDPWFYGRLMSEYVIDGLNEGFSDWVSFAMTGRTNPLDVIDADVPRDLSVDDFRWDDIGNLEDLEARDFDEVLCVGKYCIGTLFARSLYRTYLDGGGDAADEASRHEFSRTIVGALDGTLATMQNNPFPLSDEPTAACARRNRVVIESVDAPILGAFFEALLENLPDEVAPSLCENLVDRFRQAFPESSRGACNQ